MPLLCTSLLALLLLPLSLSCDSKSSPNKVRDDYSPTIQVDIYNTNRSMTTLNNLSCPVLRQKQHNCMPDNVQVIVTTLHRLACQMKNLNISQTDGLITSVLNSIQCPCPKKPTEKPKLRSKRTTTPGRRRNKQRISKRGEIRRLCRAKAILLDMNDCYEMLNSMRSDT